jgi:isopenicillin-N epimerase
MPKRDAGRNSDATDLRGEWGFPDGVIYLNHGSFGPSPKCVQQARREWSELLEAEPTDFFLRQLEDRLDEACQRLGAFVGLRGDDLLFVDNATVGMNVVAANTDLEPGDEVLCTDQEYGSVLRIWRRACSGRGARLVVRALPQPLASAEQLVETFLDGVTSRTRLIVVSHVTSPTAVTLPIEQICLGAKARGVPVCVDGPHALAMLPVDLKRIGCDFYTASCHKWLCGPFGSGFLYVAGRHKQGLKPIVTSWGRSLAGRAADWKDEFRWSGTRDPAAFLTVPAAIDFLEAHGIAAFRRTTHELANYARRRISELTGLAALVPQNGSWYGSMIALPLPASDEAPPKPGHCDPLQNLLWQRFRIEAPIIHWKGERLLRVSCHLYNTREEIDRLVEALGQLLESESK